ncbi:hypothetical protein M8C21_013578, partial [Ambrosia artemisiifolia]
MRSRGSNNRLPSSRSPFQWKISSLILSMFATMATFFVASREQLKRMSMLQKELDEAKKEGFVPKNRLETKGNDEKKKKVLAVVGILTGFGRRHNRDAIRKAWMPTGRIPFPFERRGEFDRPKPTKTAKSSNRLPPWLRFAGSYLYYLSYQLHISSFVHLYHLYIEMKQLWCNRYSYIPFIIYLETLHAGTTLKKLEDEKGIIIRFVIGRSSNLGNNSDSDISNENKKTNDFLILNDHVEAAEQPIKTKMFFINALQHWDAEFYVKVNDDIYLNIDALGAILSNHVNTPRAYIGCMKSGDVFSKQSDRWYEPEWWKFGDKK